MSLLKTTDPAPTKYPGVYSAQVYANNDPAHKYRIQMFIPQVYGTMPLKVWAPPLAQAASVPALGSVVWCIFQSGDPAYPTYVPPAYPNLPPPVTSGTTIQTFTDAAGDLWIAKNGVNGGAWKRPKEVLHARVYRSAAFTFSAGTWATMTMDTVQWDDYGLYGTAGTGYFTAPLLGWWRMSFILGASTNATGQWVQPGIWTTTNGSIPAADTLQHASLNYPSVAQVSCTRRITSLSDQYYCRYASGTALAGQAGADHCAFEMDYLGTG
jgi:hypothetical protein